MKQLLNYAITLVLWIISIVLWVIVDFPYLCWFLFGLHALEMVVISYKTGRQYGVSIGKTIVMGMLYGIVWWRPLKQKMKAETFTDADFVWRK